MTRKELLKKLNGIEWDDVEIKESKRFLPRDIWKTVSAFSNTTGGVIILGVKEENGKYKVTGIEEPDKVQNDFISTLRGDKFNIQLSSKGFLHNFKQGKVIVFRIEEMPRQAKPVYYGNDVRNTYIRMAGSTQKASRQEVERMLREASEKSSDSMMLDDFSIKDLDTETIKSFLRYLEIHQPGHRFLSCGREEMLTRLQALLPQGKNKNCLSAAGLLLFGKDTRLLNQFPSYFIDYLVIPGPKKDISGERRWVERHSSEQNIIQTFINIYDRLRKRIPIPFALKKDGITREDNPPSIEAAREALVNLLMHMDYFDKKGAHIRVYDDRIEFRNAGCLRFPVKRLLTEHITEPRNPLIAKVFRLLGWADRTGEGISKIINGWTSMGYDMPLIRDDKQANFYEIVLPLTGKKELKKAPSRDQAGTKPGP
ncbi:MAG: putative DNA binding domain-containing protein, partial [Candidatus Omnitrophica bacterium]|nr:putative DNA binding domain-containing protein [Candidatus Omnitrophota bacterium]